MPYPYSAGVLEFGNEIRPALLDGWMEGWYNHGIALEVYSSVMIDWCLISIKRYSKV